MRKSRYNAQSPEMQLLRATYISGGCLKELAVRLNTTYSSLNWWLHRYFPEDFQTYRRNLPYVKHPKASKDKIVVNMALPKRTAMPPGSALRPIPDAMLRAGKCSLVRRPLLSA